MFYLILFWEAWGRETVYHYVLRSCNLYSMFLRIFQTCCYVLNHLPIKHFVHKDDIDRYELRRASKLNLMRNSYIFECLKEH